MQPASGPRVVVQPRPEPRLAVWASIRLSSLLEMSEPDYRKWLSSLETDPLYRKLRAWPGGAVVRREPRPGSRFAWGARSTADAEGVAGLASLPGLDLESSSWIRKIGLERFERAFLRSDDPAERLEAARQAGLTPEQAERIARIVDSAELLSQERSPAPALEAPVHCVASIEREGRAFAVAYYSPHYLRGRYRVDYPSLSAVKAALHPREWARARELLRQLELANRKLSALGRILESLPAWQPEFLETGDPRALRTLRQNAAAKELGLGPSAVCRALAGRSVRLPNGREAALSEFFPSQRWRTARLVAELARAEPKRTDDEIRRELESRFGLVVTRRLVSLRRAEAGE